MQYSNLKISSIDFRTNTQRISFALLCVAVLIISVTFWAITPILHQNITEAKTTNRKSDIIDFKSDSNRLPIISWRDGKNVKEYIIDIEAYNDDNNKKVLKKSIYAKKSVREIDTSVYIKPQNYQQNVVFIVTTYFNDGKKASDSVAFKYNSKNDIDDYPGNNNFNTKLKFPVNNMQIDSNDFDSKLKIKFNNTKDKPQILAIKGLNAYPEELTKNKVKCSTLNNYFESRNNRRIYTVNKNKEEYNISQSSWPKTNYVVIKLQEKSENCKNYDYVVVENDSELKENFKLTILNPTKNENIKTVPTIKIYPGTNVKKATLYISNHSNFRDYDNYFTIKKTVDKAYLQSENEINLENNEWPIASKYVYLKIVTEFDNDKTAYDKIRVNNYVLDSASDNDGASINNLSNGQIINTDTPLTLNFSNCNTNKIDSINLLLFRSNNTETKNLRYFSRRLDGKSPYKSFNDINPSSICGQSFTVKEDLLDNKFKRISFVAETIKDGRVVSVDIINVKKTDSD